VLVLRRLFCEEVGIDAVAGEIDCVQAALSDLRSFKLGYPFSAPSQARSPTG
jgi:hypothetical protein